LDNACLQPPILISKDDHVTPRIQLWHDEEQNIQWFALNDSFGVRGADGLWKDTPSVTDVFNLLAKFEEKEVALHCIVEGGVHGAGAGGDVLPLLDESILKRISFLSVEPVTFPQKDTNLVSVEDATHCAAKLQDIVNAARTSMKYYRGKIAFSPDRQLFESFPLSFVQSASSDEDGLSPSSSSSIVDSFAVRDGPNGSFIPHITTTTNNNSNTPTRLQIPAAKLITPNAQPINPTGAGNAYAAAYAAARSLGHCSQYKAACIATGVGAVVCEYNHLPPWEWSVMERICDAAREVSDGRRCME